MPHLRITKLKVPLIEGWQNENMGVQTVYLYTQLSFLDLMAGQDGPVRFRLEMFVSVESFSRKKKKIAISLHEVV